MSDFKIDTAVLEMSESKHKEVENFLLNDMKVTNEEDLEKISQEDLTKNDLLTSDQALLLVKYWKWVKNSKILMANNWEEYGNAPVRGVYNPPPPTPSMSSYCSMQ